MQPAPHSIHSADYYHEIIPPLLHCVCHIVATDNTSGKMSDLMKCQFCSNLMDMFRRKPEFLSGYKYLFDEPRKISHIMEMPCPHAGSVRRLWETGRALNGRMDDNVDKVSLQGWADHTWEFGRLILGFCLDEQYNFDLPVSLVARPDTLGHPGMTRVLSPQWIEPSIPRAWYAKCLKEHGRECHTPAWMSLRPESIAMPEWLIDVVDNCVVPCNSDMTRYITLSYTWGGVQGLKYTNKTIGRITKRGSLHPDLAPEIPRTVRDAFQITKLLGERYLWVDSLCIAQDETDVSKALNSMHHIYANSVICLIALAGTDANHGLRGVQGVSAPRQIEQLIFDMADGERLSWYANHHLPLLEYTYKMLYNRKPSVVEGSIYNERGWTYQENVFAKRRLIFTDGLLGWACECAAWVESYCELVFLNPPTSSGVSTWWLMEPDPKLQIIQHAAKDFNSRSFTYKADTLRAFLGVQNHISRNFLGGLNYGHPEMFFDISLLWRGHGLRRRLSGNINSDPPSWSWMGWQGSFDFDQDQEFIPTKSQSPIVGYTQSVAQWYAMNFPLPFASDMRPVKCRWQICKTAVENGSSHVPLGWEKVAESRDRSEHYYRRLGRDQLAFQWLSVDNFRYPIPLPPSTMATTPIEQRPFIFARTTRAFFEARTIARFNLPPSREDSRAVEGHIFGLFFGERERAGLLQLACELDAPCSPIELVAVVKGWTTAFSEYFLNFQGREEPGGGDQELSKVSERHSCYFVLCVKWEDGVAKRQGTGMVAADIWEQHREPVELIMG